MTTHLKAALLAGVVGLGFVALEILFKITTGIAGVFVLGMGGGLAIGNEIAKPRKQKPATPPA